MNEYTGNDFYCDIALPKRDMLDIVFENDQILAFRHTKPFWNPVHIVIIPKQHIASFTNYTEDEKPVVDELLRVARIVAGDVERECGAVRVLTNLGDYQDSKHFHIHVAYGEARK